jgi:hypothetical protein
VLMTRGSRRQTSQIKQVWDAHCEYFICNLSYDERPGVRLSERSPSQLVSSGVGWYTYSLVNTMPEPAEHLLAAFHSREEFWDIFRTRVHALALAVVYEAKTYLPIDINIRITASFAPP